MSANSQISLLGRRAGMSKAEADAVAEQLLGEHRTQVLREAADVLEEDDYLGAADMLRDMADTAEGGEGRG